MSCGPTCYSLLATHHSLPTRVLTTRPSLQALDELWTSLQGLQLALEAREAGLGQREQVAYQHSDLNPDSHHTLTPTIPSPFTVTAHRSPLTSHLSPSPFTVTAHRSPLTSQLSPWHWP